MNICKISKLEFSMVLTITESEVAESIAKKAGCTVTSLFENLLDSGLCHAADQMSENQDDIIIQSEQLNSDGNIELSE